MSYNRIVISSGHGLYVRGAAGIIDEVNEARRVVDRVAEELEKRGVEVIVYHDDVSTSQDENLNRIVDFHNAQGAHELDVSCHFNAFEQRSGPVGTEVWYQTQSSLASQLSAAIADAGGFINRGGKKTTSLMFLRETAAPSVLLEICFVDSEADCELYEDHFKDICEGIANLLAGEDEDDEGIEPPEPVLDTMFEATGPCSYFGGPEDMGVSDEEGLAFHYEINETNQFLFLPIDAGTGLARRLNPAVHYLACRWDYSVTSKEMLAGPDVALVTATSTGISLKAFPADWGPHDSTGRIADLSPSLMEDLGITTDDEVEVIYPYRED